MIPPKPLKLPDPSRPWIVLTISGARELLKCENREIRRFRDIPTPLKRKELTEYERLCLYEYEQISISELNACI